MSRLLGIVTTGLILSAWVAPASAEELSSLTREDFYGGQYYRNALEHPTIQKAKSEQKKLKLVAKDMGKGWNSKKLKKAIAKFDAVESDGAIEQRAISAIKDRLNDSRIKGRVLNVLINTEEPKHVVVYVQWRASRSLDMVKEASAIAHDIAEVTPFVSTLSLAAVHPKADPKSKATVWSGKISHDSMASISPKRIDDYADRLYARLFEGVESKPF